VKKPKQKKRTAMLEALPVGIAGTFALMGIAEELIAEYKRAFPAWASLFDKAFLALCPPPGFSRLDPRVYRAHAREVLERFAEGWEPTAGDRAPTRMEAMVVLSQGSLRHPLEQAHQALYERLFAEAFGPGALEPGRRGKAQTPEPYPGACDEVLRGILRRLASRAA
jgi:hypothetical protein